jgi:hypothetical protein
MGDYRGELDKLLGSLISEYNTSDVSGFLPEQSYFDQAMQADMNEIMATLPIKQEQLDAFAASHGIGGSGELMGAMSRDVYQPIARALASVKANSRLQFHQLTLEGKMAYQQSRTQLINSILAGIQLNESMKSDWLSEVLGAFGKIGGAFTGGLAGPLGEALGSKLLT